MRHHAVVRGGERRVTSADIERAALIDDRVTDQTGGDLLDHAVAVGIDRRVGTSIDQRAVAAVEDGAGREGDEQERELHCGYDGSTPRVRRHT